MVRNVASDGGPNSSFSGDKKDGWALHAIVGWNAEKLLSQRFEPNAFGLWHMLGNVGELTRGNAVTTYENVVHAPGDGLITNEPKEDRKKLNAILRGGSYSRSVEQTRSATRSYVAKDAKIHSGGIRVSRRVF